MACAVIPARHAMIEVATARRLVERLLRQLNWQRLRLLFIGQREGGCWLRLLDGDAVHAIGMQLLIDDWV